MAVQERHRLHCGEWLQRGWIWVCDYWWLLDGKGTRSSYSRTCARSKTFSKRNESIGRLCEYFLSCFFIHFPYNFKWRREKIVEKCLFEREKKDKKRKKTIESEIVRVGLYQDKFSYEKWFQEFSMDLKKGEEKKNLPWRMRSSVVEKSGWQWKEMG